MKLLEPLRKLAAAGFEIHATPGTSRFLDAQGVKSQLVRKVSEPGPGTHDVVELVADRKVECVVNIPMRTADETVLTDGYRIRRAAADFGIPLINDTELARLFIRALLRHPRQGLDAKPLSAYATRSRPPDPGSGRS
jgi:hypothetical protein